MPFSIIEEFSLTAMSCPYGPKLKIPGGNWAEKLSVISISQIVPILIPIPKNLQVGSSKTLTSTCLNTYLGKGPESRSNGPKWMNESHTDYSHN